MTTPKSKSASLLTTLDHYRREAAVVIAARIREGAPLKINADGTAIVTINNRPLILDIAMLSAVNAINAEKK